MAYMIWHGNKDDITQLSNHLGSAETLWLPIFILFKGVPIYLGVENEILFLSSQ